MGRVRRKVEMRERCWPYTTSEKPPVPIIEVQLSTPDLGVDIPTARSVGLKIDTGYAGQVMISTNLYEEGFQLAELPEEKFGIYRTATGLVEVKRARGILKVQELDLSEEVAVETPRYIRFDRNLAGRGFLQKFMLLLNGPRLQACLATGSPWHV